VQSHQASLNRDLLIKQGAQQNKILLKSLHSTSVIALNYLSKY